MPDETGTGAVIQDEQTAAGVADVGTQGTAAIAQDAQSVAGVSDVGNQGTGTPHQDGQTVAGAGDAYHVGSSSTSPLGPHPGGNLSLLNLSATTHLNRVNGVICRVNVTTAGSTTGALYDYNSTSGYGPGNLIGVIPETVGSYEFDFPFFLGLVYVPGTSMVASISYS